MFSLATLIITALITLLVGAAAGFTLARGKLGASRTAELERRLAEAEQSLETYRRDVTEHFARTTELVNSLTESYRDVHEHLASSALKLTTPEIGRRILENGTDNLPGGEYPELTDANVEPPRDWAPKHAGEKGTLSEEYGLNEDSDADSGNTERDKDASQS